MAMWGLLLWSTFIILIRLSMVDHTKALTLKGNLGFEIFLAEKDTSKLLEETKIKKDLTEKNPRRLEGPNPLVTKGVRYKQVPI